MADILKPDLCIIGAGALGITLAIRARALDLSVVLVQRQDQEPGDGAQQALQRAAIIASADRAEAIRTGRDMGVGKLDPKPNFRAIAERAAAISETAASAVSSERLTALGITLMTEPARFADKRTLKIGSHTIRARQFVLATGSQPAVPDLPGLDQVSYFTPDSILANMRKLSHLVVIGGDAAALELAQTYCRLGSSVTLVSHGPVLPGFDPEPVAVLLRALGDEGVDIRDRATVTAILPRGQGTGVAIAHADGSLATLDASHILVVTGRRPDLDAGLIEAARLKRDPQRPDHLLVDAAGRTSNRRVLAIGGAAGVFDNQNALHRLTMLLQRASGAASGRYRPELVTKFVNTTPALAQIGQGDPKTPLRRGQTVLRASASETDAALAAGDMHGSAKLTVADNGTILAGALLGPGAGDMLAMLSLAMERGVPVGNLAALTLPPASAAASLVDLGQQFASRRPASFWARARATLRHLLP